MDLVVVVEALEHPMVMQTACLVVLAAEAVAEQRQGLQRQARQLLA